MIEKRNPPKLGSSQRACIPEHSYQKYERIPYSRNKSICPCGSGNDFVAFTGFESAGKCFNCNMFFPPAMNCTYDQSVYLKPSDTHIKYNTTNYGSLNSEAEYTYYHPESDAPWTKVVKYRDKVTGDKTFRQYRYENGNWLSGLNGREPILYNLKAIRTLQVSELVDHCFVVICEGEKDVETILWHQKYCTGKVSHDLFPTCNPMGAGNWRDSYSKEMRGLNVLILPDYDEPGKRHAGLVSKAIAPFARTVRIIRLWEFMPDLPHKGDITDFLELGGMLGGGDE